MQNSYPLTFLQIMYTIFQPCKGQKVNISIKKTLPRVVTLIRAVWQIHVHHRLLLLHCVRLHERQQLKSFFLLSFGIFFKNEGEMLKFRLSIAHSVRSMHPRSRLCSNLDQYFKSLQNKLLLSVKSSQNQS